MRLTPVHLTFAAISLAACGGSSHVSPTRDAALDVGSSASAVETFAILSNGGAAQPLSCPSAHWEFSGLAASVELRNTGSVPLAYLSEPDGWDLGAQYAPGVPTGTRMEQVGVLAPGASVTLESQPSDYQQTALLGASSPFSTYDGGYAASDEWTVPWPEGVSGSEGSTTMYVTEIQDVTACGPVTRP